MLTFIISPKHIYPDNHMILQQTYPLHDGRFIPRIALGTWQMSPQQAYDACSEAIKAGYVSIDTAAAYENESAVGAAVRDSHAKRETLFITSKVPAEIKDYDAAKKQIEQSFRLLDIDYIDLMLIHAPKPWDEMHRGSTRNYDAENLMVWKALQEAQQDGRVKSIGVSNFDTDDLDNIISKSGQIPVVNQIRVHVGHVPEDVMDYCKQRQIQIMSYAPIHTGRLLHHEPLVRMAEKYGVSVAQLCIRFDYQLGTIVLPKSTHAERIRQNADIDFEISSEDMQLLLRMSEKE